MKKIIPLAALAATLSFAPATAQAVPTSSHSQVVRYTDLDLSSPAGVARLDRRIRAAVHEVCGVPSDADSRGKAGIRRCRAATAKSIAEYRARAIASTEQAGPAELASGF